MNMEPLSKGNNSMMDLEQWFKEEASRNMTEKLLQTFTLSLTLVIGIIGNGSIIFVLVKNFSIKKIPNMLVCCLTIVNLTIALLNIPFAVTSIALDRWIFGIIWCEISGFLNQYLLTTSNTMVTMVAIYRYQAIANTFSAQITFRGAKWMMAFAVSYSLVFTIPPLFGWNSYHYSRAKGFCTISWQAGGSAMIYTVMLVLCTFVLPFIAIVFMYVRIGVITRQNTKTIRANPNSQSSVFSDKTRYSNRNEPLRDSSSQSRYVIRHGGVTRRSHDKHPFGKVDVSTSRDSVAETKTLSSVSYVILTYALLLAPYYVMNIATALSQDALSQEVDFIVAWLHYCHSAAVAIVYGYNNRRIRAFVKQLPWWPGCLTCLGSRDKDSSL